MLTWNIMAINVAPIGRAMKLQYPIMEAIETQQFQFASTRNTRFVVVQFSILGFALSLSLSLFHSFAYLSLSPPYMFCMLSIAVLNFAHLLIQITASRFMFNQLAEKLWRHYQKIIRNIFDTKALDDWLTLSRLRSAQAMFRTCHAEKRRKCKIGNALKYPHFCRQRCCPFREFIQWFVWSYTILNMPRAPQLLLWDGNRFQNLNATWISEAQNNKCHSVEARLAAKNRMLNMNNNSERCGFVGKARAEHEYDVQCTLYAMGIVCFEIQWEEWMSQSELFN